MSALTLGNLAAERDAEKSGKEVKSATETLISIIPTEVLFPYTAMVSIAMSAAPGGEYGPFRWGAFAVFILFAGLAPIASFRSRVAEGQVKHHRSVPTPECFAAAGAAAAWGMIMPGSPLELVLSGESLGLASSAIVLGSGVLLTFASAFLKRANKRGEPVVTKSARLRDAKPGQDVQIFDPLGYDRLSTR